MQDRLRVNNPALIVNDPPALIVNDPKVRLRIIVNDRFAVLLLLKNQDLELLLEGKSVSLHSIKRGPSRLVLHVGPRGRKLLQDYSQEVDILLGNRPRKRASLLFARHTDPHVPYNRAGFDKQINKVLQ